MASGRNSTNFDSAHNSYLSSLAGMEASTPDLSLQRPVSDLDPPSDSLHRAPDTSSSFTDRTRHESIHWSPNISSAHRSNRDSEGIQTVVSAPTPSVGQQWSPALRGIRRPHRDSEGLQTAVTANTPLQEPQWSPPIPTSRQADRDSDGLQLVEYDTSPAQLDDARWPPALNLSRRHNRDSEGMQTLPGHSRDYSGGGSTLCPVESDGPSNEKDALGYWQYFGKNGAARGSSGVTTVKEKQKKRRRWWIVGGFIAAIVIILVAVLGGVLGSRDHRDANKSPTSTEPVSPAQISSSPQSPSTSRIQGPGAWNGTGITAFRDARDPTLGYICFQDSHGQINIAGFNLNNETNSLILQRFIPVPTVNAANGSGIVGLGWNSEDTPGTAAHQLVYVDADGYLADLWQERAPDGTWAKGELNSHQIAAPTDNRPTMELLYDPAGGIKNSSMGAKLFAGGLDGMVHQYSFDYQNKTWFPNATHNFTGTWAYGGAQSYHSQAQSSSNTALGTALYQNTIWLADQSGKMRSYVQGNDGDGEQSNTWPSGGTWSEPLISSQQTMPNSSFELVHNFPNSTNNGAASENWMLFPGMNGNLTGQEAIASGDQTNGEFGSLQIPSVASLEAMQGSDMSSTFLYDEQYTVVFYQEDGASIAWIVLNAFGNKTLGSGLIALDEQTSQWTVKPMT